MAATPEKPKLLAIVGPTASGKSSLAMQLAELIPIEIIAVDSRTIYKGMDIGTAKPTLTERNKVPHWGIDLIEPGVKYSAQQFQIYAKGKIKEIEKRKNLPVLVGGTGLYVDSVLYDFEFTTPASAERERLEGLGINELQAIIEEMELDTPENNRNRRHLIRTVERAGKVGTRRNLNPAALVVGLWPETDSLKANIDRRAEGIFKNGVAEETRKLINTYGKAALSQTGGIVYKICMRLLAGEINEQTAINLFKTADWQYAKRQRTWFKKNNDICWFKDDKQALEHLKYVLNT